MNKFLFLKFFFSPDDGAGGGAAGGSGGGAAGDQGKKPTIEELQAQLDAKTAELSKVTAESIERKKRLKELEALEEQDKKRKEAEMSEADKAKAKLAEAEAARQAAEAALKTERIYGAIDREASALKFHNLSDARAMIDMAKVAVDDKGAVTGVKDALAALAKDKPYLIDNGQQGKGRGTPNSSQNKQASGNTGDKPQPSTARF